MRDFCVKKYNNFAEFNKDGRCLAEYVKNNTIGMTDSEKINYARFVFDKTILNSCIEVGRISDDIKNLLNCSKCELKLVGCNFLHRK